MIIEKHSFDELHLENACVTIGSFDGVHIGHQFLMRHVTAEAKRQKNPSVAITFDPLPSTFFSRPVTPHLILLPEERKERIEKVGMDYLITLPFTRRLADTSAASFINQMNSALRVHKLWVGENFSMGKDRQGSPDALRKLAENEGFEFEVVHRLSLDGAPVSSTRIRTLISQGDILNANRLLLGKFYFSGVIQSIQDTCDSTGLPYKMLEITYPKKKVLPAVGAYRSEISQPLIQGVTIFPDADAPVQFRTAGKGGFLPGKTVRICLISQIGHSSESPNTSPIEPIDLLSWPVF